VTKPAKLDPQNRRVQTDKTDARELTDKLARLVHGNDRALVVVRVPTVEQENQRTEARHRKYLHRKLQSLRAHGRGLLLFYGVRSAGTWWKESRWQELEPRLSQELRAALEDCRQLIAEYEQRLKPVEKKLKTSAPKELPRGFGALTFVLLLREIYDWKRFQNRRKVGSFLGLCGGVSSSGPLHFDLNITKAGNPYLRTLLVELAWRMVYYQPKYKAVQHWASVLSDPKVHGRHRKRAIVALARQLAVDIWKWQTGKITPEELGWEMSLSA
jgi:transposase